MPQHAQEWPDPFSMKFNPQQSIAKAVFETLEGRECMSATIGLQDGVLTVKADPNTASRIQVQLSADHRFITASVNSSQQTFRFGNDIKSLILVGSTQDDYIYVDPHLHRPAQISSGPALAEPMQKASTRGDTPTSLALFSRCRVSRSQRSNMPELGA